ncbi:hypothetical protein HW509_10730 [Asaia spathodeae]|uniref:hypothetical protein n=1 Tax=Asaia spathodeae TaxID=657016 RepID=UPI002FC3A890
MATLRTNPSLGPGLDTVLAPGDAWFDVAGNVSPLYGDVAFDGSGHKRIWATTAAALTAGAAVAIDNSGNATANASGTYTAPVAVPAGGSFWAQSAAN